MIQLPDVKIETDAADYSAAYYRVTITVPGEIGELIGMACQGAMNCMFCGVSVIAGMSMDVYDFEFDGKGLLWAATDIDNIATGLSRNEDGSFSMSLVCEKQPHDLDRYDSFAFEQKMKGVLPDDFWIEPAHLIRKLITATKH